MDNSGEQWTPGHSETLRNGHKVNYFFSWGQGEASLSSFISLFKQLRQYADLQFFNKPGFFFFFQIAQTTMEKKSHGSRALEFNI